MQDLAYNSSKYRYPIAVALALAALTLIAILSTAAQAAVVYPSWVIEPDNQTTATPATGVVLFNVKGAPNATYTATKNDTTGTTSLATTDVIKANTPWGKAFGTSAGHAYLEVLTQGPGATATATFVFLQPIEPGGWGFALGNIDVSQVQVTATSDGTRQLSGAQLTGNRVVRSSLSGDQVQGYVAAVPFNYLGTGGAKPTWVPGTVGGQLIGSGVQSDGAAGWFMPSTTVKTLTLTFTPLPGGTDPVAPQSYQLWFALRTHTISGTVLNADTSRPVAGSTLTVTDQTGAVIGTTKSDKRGRYTFANVYERSGYTLTLTVTPPSKLHVIGSASRAVDLSFGDKRVDFALTRNPNEPKPVENPTAAQIKPQLELAFDAAQVESEQTTTLTATYRNRPAALGFASITFPLPKGLTLRSSTCARVARGVVTIDVPNLQPMARSCAMTLRAASPARTTVTVNGTLEAEVAPTTDGIASASITIVPAGANPTPVTG